MPSIHLLARFICDGVRLSSRVTVFTLLLTGLNAVPGLSSPQSPPILDTEVLNHSPSYGHGFTSSHDGKWLYHTEGGSLVFVQADASSPNPLPANFTAENGAKRVPVSAMGVLVARMILDPDADLVPGPNVAGIEPLNLLYMACGRDGLWIMEADVGTGPSVTNRAWRVDDSGDIQAGTQLSRRWCSDVATCRVGNTRYLLALFTKKGDSVLRAYNLSDVRALASPGAANSELGHEIPPVYQAVLSSHPGVAPVVPDPAGPRTRFSRPVALRMAIDPENEGTPSCHAQVYVAMGPHGLARVTLDAAAISAGTSDPVWGPVFGRGSPYDVGGPAGLVPDPQERAAGLYGDLIYKAPLRFLDEPREERREATMFVDVAVYEGKAFGGSGYEGPPTHQLFVAVDSLFWLSFDLDLPFGPTMPIHHHEGQMFMAGTTGNNSDNSYSHPLISARTNGTSAVFGRALEVVAHPTDGPFLLVSAIRDSIHRDFTNTAHEAYGFNAFLAPGGISVGYPGETATFLYKIEATYSSALSNFVGEHPEGGSGLHSPPLQGLRGKLSAFLSPKLSGASSSGTPGVSMARFPTPPATGAVEAFRRPGTSMPGRMCFNVGYSILDNNLLITGGNDVGLPGDGFLVMGKNPVGDYEFKQYYQGGDDCRGAGRMILDTEAQWLDPAAPTTRHHVWSGGNHLDQVGVETACFKLMHIEVPGGDAYLNAPEQLSTLFLGAPEDRYSNPGRVYYQNGYCSPTFNQFLDGTGAVRRHLFATWQRTSEGLAVLDRAEVLAAANPDGTPLTHADDLVSTKLLTTHPEFNNMPDDAVGSAWWTTSGGDVKYRDDERGLILSWPPKLIPVREGRWVLAAPCGQIHADPDWAIYEDYPGWLPPRGSIWETGFGHGLVQFWEMQLGADGEFRPAVIRDGGARGFSPLKKIVVPDAGTNIHHLEALSMTIGGQEEVYLFCADFGGHLYVYSLRDILNPPPSPHTALEDRYLVAEWETAPNLFDDLDSLLFDLAIDYRGGRSARIYVTSPRVGIQVLKFTPDRQDPLSAELINVKRIQTPGRPSGVEVRPRADGSADLILSDWGGGIRIYADD